MIVAALSLGGVLTGMHYITLTQSPQSLVRWKNDIIISLPLDSLSADGNNVDGISDDPAPLRIGNDAAYAYDSNDKQKQATGDILPSDDKEGSDEMSTEPITPNDEQSTGDEIDEVIISRSLNFPRVTFLEGSQGNWFKHFLRGKSDNQTRTIFIDERARNEQERLLDSDDFSYRDPLYEDDCVPMQKWQETSFPICNMMHELDFYGKARSDEFRFWAKGGYNQIFYVDEKDKKDDPRLAMKVLKWGTEYSDRNFDRVRRDGLILERLTKSPYGEWLWMFLNL